MRSSGVGVYTDGKEKIGDIDELIIDKSGKIEHVIPGVGGFLSLNRLSVRCAPWASSRCTAIAIGARFD